MATAERTLLLVDATANLVLGVALLCFPFGVGDLLGLPGESPPFYATLLGAVIFGIGIALLLARAGRPGLGVEGAIAINFTGAGVLVLWLAFESPEIPARGLAALWTVAVIVLAIGAVELTCRLTPLKG